jgi:putative thioredoxin
MMASDYIIDVNEQSFEFEVIFYSQNTPVIVDFWANWCRPCKTLGPILERLALESQGGFRLARVDVDSNPNLAIKFNVRTIPTVKAFSAGSVISEFAGLLPEPRLRDFLKNITPPSPTNLLMEKADSLLSQHDWTKAENDYRKVLEMNPDQPEVLLGLIKTLLARGESAESGSILNNFPPSNSYSSAEMLLPYLKALTALHDGILPDETDLDAAFKNNIRLAQRGQFLPALDGLLDILRQDRNYQDGWGRQTFLALLELLGREDPNTRQYRSELASILF